MPNNEMHPAIVVLMLAWLLSIFGADFWRVNVAEVFATAAIIMGVIWAYVKWRSERNRKLKLIDFPNTWAAYRHKNNDILETQMVAEVFFHHDCLSYGVSAEIEGVKIPIQLAKPHSVTGARWAMEGKSPLSSIPPEAKTIELAVEIQIDGGLKKKSGKRVVTIIDA